MQASHPKSGTQNSYLAHFLICVITINLSFFGSGPGSGLRGHCGWWIHEEGTQPDLVVRSAVPPWTRSHKEHRVEAVHRDPWTGSVQTLCLCPQRQSVCSGRTQVLWSTRCPQVCLQVDFNVYVFQFFCVEKCVFVFRLVFTYSWQETAYFQRFYSSVIFVIVYRLLLILRNSQLWDFDMLIFSNSFRQFQASICWYRRMHMAHFFTPNCREHKISPAVENLLLFW